MNIMNRTDCYRLCALAELAHRYPSYIPARDIARARGIPSAYLAQLMRDLNQRGLVAARRGPGGGVALARPAQEIGLAEIIDWSFETSHCPPEWEGLFDALRTAINEAIVPFSVADLASWENARSVAPDYAI